MKTYLVTLMSGNTIEVSADSEDSVYSQLIWIYRIQPEQVLSFVELYIKA